VFAPAGTPAAVVARINAAIAKVAANPEFQSRMRDLLLGVRYLDTAQFKAFFAENDKLYYELIKKLDLLANPSK
jgi:tripartite-type tricarboxylate transporter receptor subunit TctC